MTFSYHSKSHIHSLLWLTMSIHVWQDLNLFALCGWLLHFYIYRGLQSWQQLQTLRWSSENQFLDGVHIISSLISKIKKKSFFRSKIRLVLSPRYKSENLDSFPKPLLQKKLKSDFAQTESWFLPKIVEGNVIMKS